MKIESCIKESFSVIGKEGSTEDGAGFVQNLWADANSHFAEVAHCAKKDENGNLVGIWGAMTDFSRSFQPWEDGFRKGLYLAGIECPEDAQSPEGWTKWTVPGFAYLRVVCDHDVRGWNEMNSFNGPIWTLTFEYIGNILYALVFRFLPTFALCILCAGAAVFTLDFTLGWDIFDMLPYGPQYHVKGGWSLDPAQIYLGFTRLLYPFLCGLIISRILPKRSTADNPSGSPIRLKGGFIWASLILITILSIPCIGGTDGVANGAYQAAMIILVFPLLVLIGAGSTIKSPALAKVCKFLGDISYPVYITHYPLIYLHMGFVAEHPVGSIPTWMHAASAVGVFFTAVILAWGVFKAYDEPTRKWLTDHWLKGEQKLPMWLKITAGALIVAAAALIIFKP